MRHDEIVTIFFERRLKNVRADKLRALIPYPRASQLDHARTRINTIHPQCSMLVQQLREKAPIPLAHHERAPRRADLPNERKAGLLQLIAKNNSLQQPIKWRDAIEAHL